LHVLEFACGVVVIAASDVFGCEVDTTREGLSDVVAEHLSVIDEGRYLRVANKDCDRVPVTQVTSIGDAYRTLEGAGGDLAVIVGELQSVISERKLEE